MRRTTILLTALAALMLVPAAQAFGASTLSVFPEGEGSGEVTGVGGKIGSGGQYEGEPPIECSWDGEAEEESGFCGPSEAAPIEVAPGTFYEGVAVHEIPAEGSEFAGWEKSGPFNCTTEGGTQCTAIVPEGTNGSWFLIAKFEPCSEASKEPGSGVESCEEAVAEKPLTLKINEGEGTVVSDPAGITCTGSKGEECSSEFEEGAEVTLTASPAAGYRFYNWPSCPGTATGRQCKVTMSAAKEVKVNFKKSWQLTASKAGGSQPGIIKVLPTGVTCPYKCLSSSYEFLDGQEVTVDRYEPNGQLHFTEFTGGTGSAATCNGATTPCSFTLEADSSIEALFEANAQATLSLQKEGGGQAKITSAPAGIYCFNTCDQASSQFYSEPSAEEVTLSWTLGAGTTSLEWSTGAGTCTGVKTANGSCKVTMSAAKELVATLE